MKNKLIKQNGITLIALVITIIVLLLLAGVSISMLSGQDGILSKSVDAKNKQEEAREKEELEIARQEALLSKFDSDAMQYEDLEGDFGNLQKEEYKENIAKVVDGVPIPKGFSHVNGTTKDNGLVIVDSEGNEFVWVPVTTTLSETMDADESDNDRNITIEQKQNEFDNMSKSVSIYGGFYVGRYETGGFNSTKVVSKKGEDSQSCTSANWYKMYHMQKGLYNKESDSVVSGMIYNSQWDAIMSWLGDVENIKLQGEKYIDNSIGMGHYCYDETGEMFDEFEGYEKAIETGVNELYKVKNIYDLAGNYEEYNQQGNYGYGYTLRGGHFGSMDFCGIFSPKINGGGHCPDDTDGTRSSRLQVYIKIKT